jgi:hypothetical protein
MWFYLLEAPDLHVDRKRLMEWKHHLFQKGKIPK